MTKMKRTLIFVSAAILLSGCGNTEFDNELVGQAKKLAQATPIICPDYKRFDVSLGIMRGGTGSMSNQDMWLTVTNEGDLSIIKRAVETGAIVKVKYNTRRLATCSDDHWMTSIEIVQ
jgi:PBP1b-binding outer membrane lipoprotein LpoB